MADIDILDLFNGETKKYTSSNTEIAPVELMAQFLLLITEDKLEEAFQMSEQILQFEPNNKLILEYRSALEQSIKDNEGKHDESDSSSVDNSDSDNEDSSDDDDDDESDDEDDSDDDDNSDDEDDMEEEDANDTDNFASDEAQEKIKNLILSHK